MNRSALKSYAPRARLDFIRAVTDRAAFYGVFPDQIEPITESGDVVLISGRAFPRVVSIQRRALVDRIQEKGFEQVMEAMAYTWFNRFVALRYMELHGYLDHGYRALSPAPDLTAENAKNAEKNSSSSVISAISVVQNPEILDHAEHVTLPGLEPQKVIELKLNGGQDAVLYRLLLVAQCNALHEAMPFLFEKIADETELLLPDNLLHSDSVIRKLVNEIEEADWQQVEIIGWLYQFYISDKKAEVIGKVVKSEDIPAATQLFTPNWIVKYLVQNTLGRQWLATYPDSPLRQQMEYYIEPAEQTDDVKAQLAAITPRSLDPEKLTLLDPASGSGHILVEAYDLFKAIYQERGYRSKDIPRLILEKNLFGLEIDDRAAQLAAFALLMKARADDRRIFADRIQPNVIAIQESKGLENLLRPDPAAVAGAGELPFADSDLFPETQKQLMLSKPSQGSPLAAVEPCLRELINLFEHGKTFGSLIRVPPELAAQLPAARQSIEAMIAKGQLWEHRAATMLLPLLGQAELLAKEYQSVVTNPPYMGSKFFNETLKEFTEDGFPTGKFDLFACFMSRATDFCQRLGFFSMITPPNWMFHSTAEDLRRAMLSRCCLESLIHNGRGIFGSDFGSCAFSFRNASTPSRGVFKKLFEVQGSVSTQEELRQRFFTQPNFITQCSSFSKVPGVPVAYWASDELLSVFARFKHVEDVAAPRQGLATADNDRFLRSWHEVPITNIGFNITCRDESASSQKRWFPLAKGGGFRKWYGNQEWLVDWFHDGAELLAMRPKAVIRNPDRYFKECVSWSRVTISVFSLRYIPTGFIFDATGPAVFSDNGRILKAVSLVCNSVLGKTLLEILSPLVNYEVGHVAKIPIAPTFLNLSEADEMRFDSLVAMAKRDWDSFEQSWDFDSLPLLTTTLKSGTVGETFQRWVEHCSRQIQTMQKEETANNEAVVAAYGLAGMLSSQVADEHITLCRADREQDMQRLISYAIGCMMGRYSLDKPGLVYAHSRNEGFDASQYQTFPADADGIIPITELAWFPDDATERFVEFIAKAWPREHLEENLKFIADSLGANRDEHPRDTIRRYLSQKFYKDHLQTYKRRPIYWLFSSGKQKAFQCLVYLHRYHEGTLARMRTEYVIPLQGKLSHRIEQLAGDIAAATSTSHRRKLEKERETLVKQRTELAAFDEKLRHYADMRIALDLDDGVKVNYSKFGDLLAEVKAVTGGTED